jgi:hypothetical protein
VKDLRDQINQQPDRPPTADEQVFLDYHQSSPWAQAKIKAGAHLFPESVAYMKRELAERKRAAAAYQAELEKENAAKHSPETPSADPAVRSEPPANGVGGLPSAGDQGG